MVEEGEGAEPAADQVEGGRLTGGHAVCIRPGRTDGPKHLVANEQTRRRLEATRARIEALQGQIARLTYVARGSVVCRTKVCGRVTCPCATDPAARHGPYYEWNRMEGGRRLCTMVSPEKGRRLEEAIAQWRRLEGLLQRWQRETVRAIDLEIDASH